MFTRGGEAENVWVLFYFFFFLPYEDTAMGHVFCGVHDDSDIPGYVVWLHGVRTFLVKGRVEWRPYDGEVTLGRDLPHGEVGS